MAYIARTFRGLDPVALLDDGGDEFGHLVRLGAAQYIAEREEAAAKEAEAKSKR